MHAFGHDVHGKLAELHFNRRDVAEEVVPATAKPTTAHIVHHRLPQCSAEDALEMPHRHARMTCNALRSHFLVEMLLGEGTRSLELF